MSWLEEPISEPKSTTHWLLEIHDDLTENIRCGGVAKDAGIDVRMHEDALHLAKEGEVICTFTPLETGVRVLPQPDAIRKVFGAGALLHQRQERRFGEPEGVKTHIRLFLKDIRDHKPHGYPRQ
jgi:hypothetical protein